MTIPATLKTVDARLTLVCVPDEAHRSEIDMRAPFPAPYREIWRISAAYAAVRAADAPAIMAAFEALDGRAKPFTLELRPPAWGQASPPGVALAAAVAPGDAALSLTVPSGATLLAGTLIGLGDPGTAGFQLFETAEDVTGAGAAPVSVPVHPRARRAFAPTVGFACGAVTARFVLTSDAQGASSIDVSTAVFRLDAVEAVL